MGFRKMTKKILIFSTAYLPLIGGAEIAIKEITDRLSPSATKATEDRSDYEFDLICARIDKKLPKEEKIGRINVHRVGSGSNLDKLFLPITGFLKASFLFNRSRSERELGYDAIWAIMASHGGLTALFFKLFHPQIPFLLTLQEGDPIDYIKKHMKPFFLFRLIFQRANYIQAISNYLAKWGRQMGAKYSIEVVPNGVDANKFKIQNSQFKITNQNLKPELNIGSNEKVIITTSRLVSKNGVGDLIEAMRYLKFPFKLLIIGDGEERKNLELQVSSCKLQDKILFLGSISYDEIPVYLAMADVFVRPSLSEGLGNAFLEAMACGVPIIGTPVGGIPDFLIDPSINSGQATGLFCEVKNPQSIAEKINLLLNDNELRNKLITNAKKLVAEKYNWDLVAQKIGDIFQKIQNTKGPHHPFCFRQKPTKIQNTKLLITTGIFPPDIGGPAIYSKLLVNELPKHGLRVEVLSFGSVRHLPKVFRHFVYFLKVLKLGRRADVIFAQDPVSVGLPSFLAAKILGKKFILKIVGDYAWEQSQQRFGVTDLLDDFVNKKYNRQVEFLRNIQKFVAKNASIIITPSEYLKKIVSCWGVNPTKIKVILNTFYPLTLGLSRDEARKKLNLSGTVLVSVGRLVPWKGFGLLIEIMPEILNRVPDAKLLIIGDGPENRWLADIIKKLNLEKSVFLIGRMFQSNLLVYLRASDIFLLNTAYEGLSHAILEALAVGLPVITTKVGGNPEVITHEENGFLLEYNNKKQWSEAIVQLLSSPELREKFITKGKQRLDQFSWQTLISKTIEVILETSH